jgi:predicted negative regulator of RcsB-dependent stress response
VLAEQGEVAGARAVFQQVIDSGHPDMAPRAMVNLGELLDKEGDVAGARAAYQQAIDSGHSEAASRALEALGDLPAAVD